MTLKLSIITPSLNQGKFIRDTIDSVLSQGYGDLEHLVIDGGSSDDTLPILKQYPHLSWTSERDRGQADAVNKGISRVQGDIVGWINSDDVFLPGTFDAVIRKFQSEPDCHVVFGDYHATDEHGATLYSVKSFCGSYEEMIRWWDYTYAIHQPTVFVRKHVFDVAGLLDETFHYAMDYEWWLRVAKHFTFSHIPFPMATYRMHEDSKTYAPLEENIYPEQLRASKKHWGPYWQRRYWMLRSSYRQWLLRKAKETSHHPSFEFRHQQSRPGPK